MKQKPAVFLFLLLLFVNGAHVAYNFVQPPIRHNAGLGFDGVNYYKMYAAFKAGTMGFQRLIPYNNRVLVPFLASLVPLNDPFLAFKIVNGLFMNAFVIMLYFLWRRVGISHGLIALAFAWFFLHWIGPNRYYVHYPILVDVPTYFFQAVLLWMAFKDDYAFLPFVAPFGALQKESFLILTAALFCYKIAQSSFPALVTGRDANDAEKRGIKVQLALLCASLLIMLVSKFLSNRFLIVGAGASEWDILKIWFTKRMTDPSSLSRWAAGIFIAFGPFPLLLACRSDRVPRGAFPSILVLFSVIYCALGYVGGSDITRIVFLGYPTVMTLALISIKNLPARELLPCVALSLPVLRLLETIGEPDLSMAENATGGYYSWFAEYCHPSIANFWVLYAVILYLAIGRILKPAPSEGCIEA